MSFFDSYFNNLTFQAIESLVSRSLPEGQEIELKRGLSSDVNEEDTWRSQRRISKSSIEALVKEIVAFANSRGGVLLLGVDEKDGSASEIMPLDDAIDLSDRLSQRCRDNIEPSLLGLEVRPVCAEGSNSGVVVFRIPASPYAPHRSRADRQCYERRGTSSVPMTMDDIHRQILDGARRWEKIDAWFDHQKRPTPTDGWRLRAVARPLAAMHIPRLHRRQDLRPRIAGIRVQVSGQTVDCYFKADHSNWRPIVRGSKCVDVDTRIGNQTTLQVNEDGGLVFDWKRKIQDDKQRALYVPWLVGMFANMLLAIERLRVGSQQFVDYGVEFHIATAQVLSRGSYLRNSYGHEFDGHFDIGTTMLGRYLIGDRSTFEQVLENFETDVDNLAGIDSEHGTMFDITSHLAELDKIANERS